MTEVNYSFSMGSAPRGEAKAELYSFNGIRAVAGPEGTVLLLNPRTHQKMMVQPEVAQALRHCASFKALSAHAQHLTTILAPLKDHPEVALQTLEQVREAGMLESAAQAWLRLTQNSTDQPESATCRVFILTCDRPEALDRLLASLSNGPVPIEVEGIWVVDDSRQKASLQANARIIEAHRDSLSVPLYHFDLEQRARLITHLKSSLPAAEAAIDFLLNRNHWGQAATYGLARNLSLLLSVGQRALVLDDDVIAEAVAPPLSPTDLWFGTANDREAIFYRSQDALRERKLTLDASPLALMLDQLGRPLGSVVADGWQGPGQLAGTKGGLIERFGAGSRVLLTQCGSWGDLGAPGNSWIHYLPEASLKRLLEAPEALPELLVARSAWMGYRGPTLTENGTLSQLTGLQHTELLPPYLPAGRGEDILFALMLQRLHPESAVWNAGWAIPHHPIDDRSPPADLPPLKVEAGLSLLAEWLGKEPRDQWGLTPARRLQGMAEEVRRLVSMEDRALSALVAEEHLSRIGANLSRVMQQLKAVPSSGNESNIATWRAFLEASRDQLVTQIQTVEIHPLAAAVDKLGAEGITTLRHMGRGFAEAMGTWPEICESARSFE